MHGVHHCDVIVVGAGPVGMAVAIALNQAGMSVSIIDKNALPEKKTNDNQSKWFALGVDVLDWLKDLNWHLSYEPIAHLTLSCQEQKPDIVIHSSQANEPFLTAVVHSHVLYEQGYNQLAHGGIALFLSNEIAQWIKHSKGWCVVLKSGETLFAPLVIGADGTHSSVRSFFDPPIVRWNFGQKAVVFRLKSVPTGCAYEHFFPQGSLAVLSLCHGKGAGIWIGPTHAVCHLNMAHVVSHMLGIDSDIEGSMSIFDVYGHWVAEKIFHRCVLVGDAAHAIHPIAGQGLNLGLRHARHLVRHIIKYQQLGLDWGLGLHPLRHIWGMHSASMQIGTTGLVYALGGKHASAWWSLGSRIMSWPGAKKKLIAMAAGKMFNSWYF